MINEDRLVSLFKKLCLINAPALKEQVCGPATICKVTIPVGVQAGE